MIDIDKRHREEIESYINGNISDFKKYIRLISKVNLLECTRIFCDDYGYTIKKMIWLLEG